MDWKREEVKSEALGPRPDKPELASSNCGSIIARRSHSADKCSLHVMPFCRGTAVGWLDSVLESWDPVSHSRSVGREASVEAKEHLSSVHKHCGRGLSCSSCLHPRLASVRLASARQPKHATVGRGHRPEEPSISRGVHLRLSVRQVGKSGRRAGQGAPHPQQNHPKEA